MPFDEQKELIDDIRAQIDPPGTEPTRRPASSVEVVGLPVLAADANAALDSNRYLLTGAGLLVRGARPARRLPLARQRALVPLVPIVLAPAGRRWCSRPPTSRSTRCRRRSARW